MSVPSDEKRIEFLSYFMAARAEYLTCSGWVPVVPAVLGGPVWWKSPHPDDECSEHSDTEAARMQEARDYDIVKRQQG